MVRKAESEARYRLGGGETICPRPPLTVRLAADLRPSADVSAVRTWLSCRQPAYLGYGSCAPMAAGTDRRTDRRIA